MKYVSIPIKDLMNATHTLRLFEKLERISEFRNRGKLREQFQNETMYWMHFCAWLVNILPCIFVAISVLLYLYTHNLFFLHMKSDKMGFESRLIAFCLGNLILSLSWKYVYCSPELKKECLFSIKINCTQIYVFSIKLRIKLILIMYIYE